jgi:hypothetical protein
VPGRDRPGARDRGIVSYFLPRHLSVSAVSLYARCPAQWKQRYVDRVQQPPTMPQAWGTAFHKALETLHRGGDGELSWLEQWDAFDAAMVEHGQQLFPGKEQGLKLLRAYRARGLDTIMGEPERKFVFNFPTARVPVPVLGARISRLQDHRRELLEPGKG